MPRRLKRPDRVTARTLASRYVEARDAFLYVEYPVAEQALREAAFRSALVAAANASADYHLGARGSVEAAMRRRARAVR